MDRNVLASALIKLAKSLLSEKEEKKEEQVTLFSKSKKAMPMLVLPRRLEKYHLLPIMTVLRNTMGVDSRAEAVSAQYLTFREGSSNKFHYFAIFETPEGEYVGGNAWGRIGYSPKAIEIARGSLRHVESAVMQKMNAKYAKGYRTDSME
jgi:hypothetical protein